MVFRVYDNERNYWLDDVYMTSSGDLVMIKKTLGLVRYSITLDPSRFIYHKSIDLQDVNGIEVYEGDYLLAKIDEDKEVVGLVVFADELSAYIILVEETSEYYTLGSGVIKSISIVGNVFDGLGV